MPSTTPSRSSIIYRPRAFEFYTTALPIAAFQENRVCMSRGEHKAPAVTPDPSPGGRGEKAPMRSAFPLSAGRNLASDQIAKFCTGDHQISIRLVQQCCDSAPAIGLRTIEFVAECVDERMRELATI